MISVYVYSAGKFVATVNKQPREADGFNAAEPWLLLHNTGRIDRFAKQADARAEAEKSYPAATFSKI